MIYLSHFIRIALILFWILNGYAAATDHSPNGFRAAPSLETSGILFAFLMGPIIVHWILFMSARSPRKQELWTRPSFASSILDRSQPLQFLFMGALCFISFAVSSLLTSIFRGEVPIGMTSVTLAFGSGLLLGAFLAPHTLKKHFHLV
jgi:hypothetical protein